MTKLSMLQKTPLKKKSQGCILLRNWTWKLRELVGFRRSSSLQKNHGKLFHCPRVIKISFLEKAVCCHRRPLGLGIAPSSTLRCKFWYITIVKMKVLNLMHIFIWLNNASSILASRPNCLLSSFVASKHKPHKKWSQKIFLVCSMYIDVHSSRNNTLVLLPWRWQKSHHCIRVMTKITPWIKWTREITTMWTREPPQPLNYIIWSITIFRIVFGMVHGRPYKRTCHKILMSQILLTSHAHNLQECLC